MFSMVQLGAVCVLSFLAGMLVFLVGVVILIDNDFDKKKKEEKIMVPKDTKNLHWKDAWFHLLNGHKIKRPLWEGYWAWENNTIMMHCRDGSVTDIRETENPAYTFTNVAARDWMIVD